MLRTYPRQTFLDRKLTKLPAQIFALFFPIFTANHSFSCPRASLVHPFVSSCGSPSTTNPSGPIASTSRHLSSSPNLTNPLLSLAVPRTHNYFAYPTVCAAAYCRTYAACFSKVSSAFFPLFLSLSYLFICSLCLCVSLVACTIFRLI